MTYGDGKFIFRWEQTRERKLRNEFGDGKYMFAGEKICSRGKGRKHLEKQNMLFAEEKNNWEGKGGSFTRGQSIRMIFCKRLVHLDDHLQDLVNPDDHLKEAGRSRRSFARGWSIQMIICKRLVDPNDHLQEACQSGLFICKRPVDPDDHLQEDGPSG